MIKHKNRVKHVIILFFITLPQLKAALTSLAPRAPEAAMMPPTMQSNPSETPASKPGADTPLSSSRIIGEQGNWVKKRKWLEQALAINKQIQDTVINIQESRTLFQEKRDAIDSMLDTFYQSKGLIQGELNKTFDDTEQYIAKKKERAIKALHEKNDEEKQGGSFDYHILEIEDTIKQLHSELEQLRLDIKSIEALDNSLSDRLKTLDLQIGTALTQSSQSRILSEKMWYLIDDNKARDVFYHIKTLEEQGKNILNYVQVTLKQDFENVIEKIKTQIQNVTKEIEQLESKGLIIQNRSQRLDELRTKNKAEEAARLKKENEEQRELLRKKNKKQSPTMTWYMQPLSVLSSVTSLVGTSLSATYNYFFGNALKQRSKRKKRHAQTLPTDDNNPEALAATPNTVEHQETEQQPPVDHDLPVTPPPQEGVSSVSVSSNAEQKPRSKKVPSQPGTP